eukprot:618917-Pelagomonas_calceolata.AAC.1
MGIRRVTSSTPCLIMVIRVEICLLKSASGASNFGAPVTPTKRKRTSQGPNSVQHQHCPPPAAGAAAP